jgi:hypothetical protein
MNERSEPDEIKTQGHTYKGLMPKNKDGEAVTSDECVDGAVEIDVWNRVNE